MAFIGQIQNNRAPVTARAAAGGENVSRRLRDDGVRDRLYDLRRDERGQGQAAGSDNQSESDGRFDLTFLS